MPQLSEVDRLRLENLSVKIQNLDLQIKQLKDDVIKATQMRIDFVKQHEAIRTEFQKTYGIDINTVSFLPDGTVIVPKE